MSYKHGVYASEKSSNAPAVVSATVPVVFGVAPINLSSLKSAPVNEPVLCRSYADAVNAFGYSDDWAFTLCEFIYSHFVLFEAAPAILVNVLDPSVHKKSVTDHAATLSNDLSVIKIQGVLLDSVVVKSDDGATTYESGKDYSIGFDGQGNVVLQRITSGTIPENATKLTVAYDQVDPSLVTSQDIIGGVESDGKATGLELLNQVFPRFTIVPSMVLAPGYSQDPIVAAVMTAKAGNINNHFKCAALTDIPTDEVTSYTEAPSWKKENNYTYPRQFNGYPKVSFQGKQYHLSTQLAGVMCVTDSENGNVPYVSPSNQSLRADGAVLKDGTEVFLGPDQAAFLNGNGIVTALNFIGGWKAWGNRTGVYPGQEDPTGVVIPVEPKDSFIPLRRMMDWIANNIILTYWKNIDGPITRRLIEAINDSLNLWFNGLTSQGYLLGGRVEFNASENNEEDLMDGIVRFHVYATSPSPGREIDFIIEYDANYLKGLLG